MVRAKINEVSSGKPINLKRSSDELENSDVHAITGATQTSTRLEKIINNALKNWLSKLNQTQGKDQIR